jgi:hypothetical protein
MQLPTCGGSKKFFLLKLKWRVVVILKSYRSPFPDDSLTTASVFWFRPETLPAELVWRLCTYWRQYEPPATSTVSEVAWNAIVAASAAAAGCELPCGNCSLAPDPLRAGHHFHKPRRPAPEDLRFVSKTLGDVTYTWNILTWSRAEISAWRHNSVGLTHL